MRTRRLRHGWKRVSMPHMAVLALSPVLMAQAPAELGMTSHLAMEAAIVSGAVIFGALSGVAVLRARRRSRKIQKDAEDALRHLQDRLNQQDVLNSFEERLVLIWAGRDAAPQVSGGLHRVAGVPDQPMQIMDFSIWLAPESAAELSSLIDLLRQHGSPFEAIMRTQSGALLEAEGRCTATAALVRLRDMSAQRQELAHIAERHSSVVRDLNGVRALLAQMPHPAFLRDAQGQLTWVNDAYVRVLGLASHEDVVARQVELFDAKTCQEMGAALKEQKPWRKRMKLTTPTGKASFEVFAVPTPRGSACMASDVGEAEGIKRDLQRLTRTHQDTLDNLSVPVCVYAADQRLAYYNAAWRDMWGLSDEYLKEKPDAGAILDRLRQEHKLPEEANYKLWRAEQLACFDSATNTTGSSAPYWHLPDGRSLKIHTHRNPLGGVTIVQEDETSALTLQSRFEASKRMGQETLDALSDAVIVFGSDGRWVLSNPAFEQMWQIPAGFFPAGTPTQTKERPHLDDILARARKIPDDVSPWGKVAQAVFAMGEQRRALSDRLYRHDGSVIDAAALPMAEGATLITFVDVTAQANVERALTERNEALEAADRIKNSFVYHISYELRSPLTNIMGFAEMLADPKIGALNDKQREYTGYIASSSKSLYKIIDDILELAAVDAGSVVLDLARVDVRETVLSAVEGVHDRLNVDHITLKLDIADNVGGFIADARRIRQMLYNLLSNAIGFSEPEQSVTLQVRRDADVLVFRIEDHGRGIEPELLQRIFERFETNTTDSRHRGVGLGLSIVKSFTDLHKGCIEIDSSPGHGTTVTVRLPENPQTMTRSLQPALKLQPNSADGHAVVSS